MNHLPARWKMRATRRDAAPRDLSYAVIHLIFLRSGHVRFHVPGPKKTCTNDTRQQVEPVRVPAVFTRHSQPKRWLYSERKLKLWRKPTLRGHRHAGHVQRSPLAISYRCSSGELARWRKPHATPRQRCDDSSPLELGTWPRALLPECRVHACPISSRSVLFCPVPSRPVLSCPVSCRTGCPAVHPSRVCAKRAGPLSGSSWSARIRRARGMSYQWNAGCRTRHIVPITVNRSLRSFPARAWTLERQESLYECKMLVIRKDFITDWITWIMWLLLCYKKNERRLKTLLA